MSPQRTASPSSRAGCRLVAAAALALAGTAPAAAQSIAAQSMQYAPATWQGPASASRQGELRVGLTQRTHFVYEPRPWQPATPLPADYTVTRPQASFGLEFRSAPKDQGVRSLLRVQLSGDSFVQFRPRSRGLAVTYKSQF